MLTTKKNILKSADSFVEKSVNMPSNNVFSTNKPPHNFSDNEKIQSQVNKISEIIKSEKQLKHINPPQIINKNIVYNVINPDDPSTIMVKFDNETFSFYDNKKSHLGSFAIKQLLKYITNDNNFLSSISMGTSSSIIETFICNTQQNKIRIYDHIASIFMGNLEMLIKLNNSLFKYEKIFEKDSNICNKKCLLKIKAFNFTLLNHTLKIISTISNEYKTNNIEIKNKLLRYSVGIVYRLVNYIRERFTTNIDNTKIIHDNIDKLSKTRNDLINHINSLNSAIIKQSQQINILIDKMDNKIAESSTEKYVKNTNDISNDNILSNKEEEEEEEEEYIDDFSGALTISKSKLTTSEYLKNPSDIEDIEDIEELEELDDYINTDENGYKSNTEQYSESDKRLQITSETDISEYSKIENLSEEII